MRAGRTASSPHRRPGQALVELALVLPVLVALFFGTYSYWNYFQHNQVYSLQAQALAEWIGRSGMYTATMRDTIQDQLEAAAAVDSADAYLYVYVSKPDGTSLDIGEPVPASASGNPPAAPVDRGWDSIALIAGLPVGSAIEVDIWGYDKVEVPMLPISIWNVAQGHAVMLAQTEF